MEIDQEYIKAAFRGFLKKRGQSQNWLALQSGVTQQTINNMARGSLGSDKSRDQVFKFMGTDLLGFLEYGRMIYNHERGIEPAPEQEIEPPVTANSIIPKLQTLSQSDLDIVNALVDRLNDEEERSG